MDHKLLLQLLQNKTEEIQSLLNHFKSEPNDLTNGLHLLSDRIESLSREFLLMKDNFKIESPEVRIQKTVLTSIIEESANEKIVIKEPKEILPSKKIEESALTEGDAVPILNNHLQTEVIGEKPTNNKLSNIQSSIGINDRFLFIRELFNNNTEAYNSSINFINQTENYKLIEDHFKLHTDWAFDNPTVIQFMELVKRKF